MAIIVTALIAIAIGCLCLSVFFIQYRRRYAIRKAGNAVMAQVTDVRCWQDAIGRGYTAQAEMVPLLGRGWQYEVTAEWTDPATEQTYIFSSGRKKGLPSAKRGDHLLAYMSQRGNYLELP